MLALLDLTVNLTATRLFRLPRIRTLILAFLVAPGAICPIRTLPPRFVLTTTFLAIAVPGFLTVIRKLPCRPFLTAFGPLILSPFSLALPA